MKSLKMKIWISEGRITTSHEIKKFLNCGSKTSKTRFYFLVDVTLVLKLMNHDISNVS